MSLSAVVILGAGSYALRVLGLTLVAAGRIPVWARVPLRYLPPAVLAALVTTLLAGADEAVRLDARFVGVAVGALLVWRRVPLVVVMVAAAAVTAVLRAQGW